MLQFPANPIDGTIYEVERGLFFIYSKSSKSWNRLDGNLNPTLATPFAAGLMSKEDLNKLNRLIIPPLSTSLRSQDHEDIVFNTGVIGLSGGTEDATDSVVVHVDGTAPLMNVAANIDRNNAQVVDRVLHLDSNTFDFYVDVDEIRDLLMSLGSIKIVKRQGKPGIRGGPGRDGGDKLHHGPDGEQGDPGNNAPIVGSLSGDPVRLEAVDNETDFRGVVQISTEEVSPEENYLVLTRASIGDPDAAPDKVRIGAISDGTWLVVAPIALDQDVHRRTDICQQSADAIYYLNIEPILEAIRIEFEVERDNLRKGMERITNWWLTVMSSMFDEQKGALCCALEYCQSQTRNTETRRYIEQARLTASATGGQVILDPNPKSGEFCDIAVTPMHPACGDGFGTLNRKKHNNNSQPIGAGHCVPVATIVDGIPYKFRDCPPGMTPRDVVDGTVPPPKTVCDPRTIGSFTTNINNPIWDLTPFQVPLTAAPCAGFWRLIEMADCYPPQHPWYASGCIAHGLLVGLPNKFTSAFPYDGFLELQVGYLGTNGKINWPGICQTKTPIYSCNVAAGSPSPSPEPPTIPSVPPTAEAVFGQTAIDFIAYVGYGNPSGAGVGFGTDSCDSALVRADAVSHPVARALGALSSGVEGRAATTGGATVGDVKLAGGNGAPYIHPPNPMASEVGGGGGGGGGGAGPRGRGASATARTGASAVSEGGAGGDGTLNYSVTPQNGSSPGGGGGGSYPNWQNVSVGGDGQIRVTLIKRDGSSTTQTFTEPGRHNFTKAAGVVSIIAECWGAGAPGGPSFGGAGGNYSSKTITV